MHRILSNIDKERNKTLILSRLYENSQACYFNTCFAIMHLSMVNQMSISYTLNQQLSRIKSLLLFVQWERAHSLVVFLEAHVSIYSLLIQQSRLFLF